MVKSQQRPVADDITLHFGVRCQTTHINQSQCLFMDTVPNQFLQCNFLHAQLLSFPVPPSFLCVMSIQLHKNILPSRLNHFLIQKILYTGKNTYTALSHVTLI